MAVGDHARSVLRLDPDNRDALTYLAASERDPTPQTTLPAPEIESQRPPNITVPAPENEEDLSRARLEQYIPKELLAKLEGARAKGAGSGERRVVTMLFCDVTGSTSAAERLDPEEWAEIMNGAFGHLISPIYRYEGTLARLMGDAILAFFGAPIAHEDDPQRAVLAGLDIVEGIRSYQEEVKNKWNLDFGVRVGINTGLVVVGEVGSDMRVEYTVMGDAINLAARMEQTAPTGSVQISGDTHNLIAPLFEFEAPEEIEVKGKSQPVAAYRVIGSKAIPGSLRGIEGLSTPVIGRDKEIGVLRQVLENLHQGSGGIVCLMGEAGIGKSCLIDQAQKEWATIAGAEAPWIVGRGVSYDTTRPYGLFMQRLLQVFGIEDNDSRETVRQKVATSPDTFAPEVQSIVVRAVEALLAFGSDAGGHQAQGETLQNELYEACHGMWKAAAAFAPTVLVLDDLHWADPASVELMIDMFSLVDEVPLLFFCAFRPERQSPAWQAKQAAETEYPHRYTEVNLSALSDDDSEILFGNLLNITDSPPELRDMILAKTGGNPLFVEEFLRTLIDTGAVIRDEGGTHWRADTMVSDIPIPNNLQALLTARIDRLEEDARRTLQLSSVIGRSFQHGVLQIISDSSIALERQLTTLQRAELIRKAGRIPDLEYIFRHDLTREAAYNSILLRERREFHQRVGEAVEEMFGDRLDEQAHLLAHHFYQAGETQRALKYSIMAGDTAARLYANEEACTHYTRAIDLARQGELENEEIIDLYLARGRAQEVGGNFENALAGYQELEQLGRSGSNPALELAALTVSATIYSTINGRPDAEKARALSERSLLLAQELNDHRSEAKILWNQMLIENIGDHDYHKALEYGEQSLRIARMYGLDEQTAYTQHDIARAHFTVGQFPEGKAASESARRFWRETGNRPMLADNLINGSGIFYAHGLFTSGNELLEEALEISRSIGSVLLESVALSAMAQSHMESGELGRALAAIDEGLSKTESAPDIMPALLHATAASVYGLYGIAQRSLDEAIKAIGLASLSHQVWYFQIPLALAHLKNGNLTEASEALLPMYEGPKMESKQNMEYLGIISPLPYLIRNELALAQQDYDRVLSYSITPRDQVAEGGERIVLPDLLRVRALALNALGRVGEAGENLAQARIAAEAQGSKRALWPILIEMSQVASIQGNQDQSQRLLNESKEIIDFIAARCGSPEMRYEFLNSPHVRLVLETG